MISHHYIDWRNPISDHPLNHGLVGWWLVVPHWTGGTTWRDLCSYRLHGTLTSMTPATDWIRLAAPGHMGSLDFDGTDAKVVFPRNNAIDQGFAQLTVSQWVRPTAAQYGFATNCWSPSATSTLRRFAFFWNGGATASARYIDAYLRNGSGGQYLLSSASALVLNDWSYITMTHDGSTLAIYINGVFDASMASAGSVNTSSLNVVTGVGSNYTSPLYPWAGQQDDIRIINRALTGPEVAELYQRSRAGNRGLLRPIQRRVFKSPAPATGQPTMRRWQNIPHMGGQKRFSSGGF